MPSDDCTHVSWPRFLFSILTGVVKRLMNKDITLIFECSLFVSKDAFCKASSEVCVECVRFLYICGLSTRGCKSRAKDNELTRDAI